MPRGYVYDEFDEEEYHFNGGSSGMMTQHEPRSRQDQEDDPGPEEEDSEGPMEDPSYDAEGIGCSCNDEGLDSEWNWDSDAGVYICTGCGEVQ